MALIAAKTHLHTSVSRPGVIVTACTVKVAELFDVFQVHAGDGEVVVHRIRHHREYFRFALVLVYFEASRSVAA